jgi:EAL domain-containing protein (putative c-di-GMP-specific phosphodiesterase class I)
MVGPDDHALVLDALDTFALEQLRKSYEQDQGNGRIKVVFAAREPRGALRGALLIEAAERSLGGRDGERGSMQRGFARLLHRLALRLAGKSARTELPPEDQPRLPVLLFVQQLLKLRSSGRTRRYEVLLRSDTPGKVAQKAPADLLAAAEQPDSGGKLDRYVVDELCRWLTENRSQLEVDPASFTVNLSIGALLSEPFIDFLEKTMKAAQLGPRMLGFEIREQQCLQHPQEERFGRLRPVSRQVDRRLTFHSALLVASARRAHAGRSMPNSHAR